MKRRTARERGLQALFQIDISEIDPKEAIENVMEEETTAPYVEQIVLGTMDHLQEIDEIIGKHSEHWSFDRLAKVDRNILRIAVYEMKYMEDVPFNVAITEAVQIAKKFSEERSSKFINGVLSNIKKTLE
ncbi:N utilization substance protein B [Oikeobacillus pervagus]|uniref:Transcription antitermination protein NusB n=1 Tax=Oikeobacillus pervagus TaxID=1325931 RepID=A0AAJ1WHP4_9BACI|nr:transcription antitermination factor NusB [Oikeobacillus pervagus]MDQ0213825.1 N utilization substance protein B [Oikeobacillus pervagus]